MGFNISWLAFSDGGRANALAALGLLVTGEPREWPDGDLLFGAELPGSVYIVMINDCFHEFVSPECLSVASRGTTLIGCQVEEHIMASAAFCWRDGSRVWNVAHEAQREVRHLDVEGHPPRELRALEEAASGAQAKETPFLVQPGFSAEIDHYFRVPIDLAALLVGYEHDRIKYAWGRPMYEPLAVGIAN